MLHSITRCHKVINTTLEKEKKKEDLLNKLLRIRIKDIVFTVKI